MIYVEMKGRCGNQFFHYACARYVQIKIKDDQLILNYNKVFSLNKEKEGWIDYLKDFRVVPYEYYIKRGSVMKNESNLFQKIIIGIKAIHMGLFVEKDRAKQAKAAPFLQNILNYVGVYWIKEGVDKITPYKRKCSIVGGTCEGGVFHEIADELRKELSPRQPILEGNLDLLKRMEDTDSVCVSVRRGDFFDHKHIKSFGVCTSEYYYRAKEKMDEQNFGNPAYFVFSDDVEWCKNNLKFMGDITFVQQDMPVYETLRLMYSCKHFIISNSTFSWWGQFLSRNENKIVISPSRWNNDGYDSKLIDKKWILIDI